MRAQAAAVDSFSLGERLDRLYYGVWPVQQSPWEVAATAAVLALIGSVVTTFAGLIADPVQLWTGMHKRRLMRLVRQLESGHGSGPELEGEHLMARAGDLSDLALSLWRAIRG